MYNETDTKCVTKLGVLPKMRKKYVTISTLMITAHKMKNGIRNRFKKGNTIAVDMDSSQ
jgi:hypothetical protein